MCNHTNFDQVQFQGHKTGIYWCKDCGAYKHNDFTQWHLPKSAESAPPAITAHTSMNQTAIAVVDAVSEPIRGGRYSEAIAIVKDHLLISPIPMILYCPMCKARHIDIGEFATKPHATHACQKCGHCWRMSIVPTIGVQFLPGFKNE